MNVRRGILASGVMLMLAGCGDWELVKDKGEDESSGDFSDPSSYTNGDKQTTIGYDDDDQSACYLSEDEGSADSGFSTYRPKRERRVDEGAALSLQGGIVGNGGDVVVCKDGAGNVTRAELLDFLEAEINSGLTLSLGAPTLSAMEKVELVMARIERLDPERAALYRERAATFETEAHWLAPDVELPDVVDTAQVVLPTGCELKQLAIQRTPNFPGDKRYNISRKYWDMLDEDQRAGLILHELIYREALSFGHLDSLRVRVLTGLVASATPETMTAAEYVETLTNLGFEAIENVQGIRFVLGTVERYSGSDKVQRGRLFDAYAPVKGLSFAANTMFSLYESGEMKEGVLGQDYREVSSCTRFPSGLALSFDKNGVVVMVDGSRFRSRYED